MKSSKRNSISFYARYDKFPTSHGFGYKLMWMNRHRYITSDQLDELLALNLVHFCHTGKFLNIEGKR